MPAEPLTAARVRAGLAHPDPDARPMMRWWWFGPDVEDAEIERELRAMAAAGLGGAEVAFVYPLREGAPDYLSAPVLASLRRAAELARELGLRLDVTGGSGWSYGGAHIGPEHAARRLDWERRDIGLESIELPRTGTWPGDELIAAYLGEGADGRDWTFLPDDGDHLRIPAGRGPRRVLVAWSRLTGQQVKRASAGAEGPVIDHFSAAAARHHLDVVGGALLEAVPAHLLGSLFSDSLEVYGADWTPDLPAQFARRRGYALLPHLPLVLPGARIAGDPEVDADRLRGDLGRTRSELVEDGFVAASQDWAREHGIPFRLQGYGQPPIEMSANRLVDQIEGEGVGWKGIGQTRWATSAAHLYGRDSVSTEIWTWVHSPSFAATPLDLKGEAHEHLLLGSTRFVGHGWPYSPPDVPGLGWSFYAAGALDDRNPWWPAMPQLSRYLTGLCWLLRQGEGVADVKLYLPYDDVRAEHPGPLDLWRECAARVGPEIPAAIRENGYDLDLVDDAALAVLDPADAPVLVLPAATRIPAPTRERIDALIRAGGAVIAVDVPYPGAHAATRADLAAVLRGVLAPDLAMTGDGGEIGVVHRRLEDADLYFVANTGPELRTIALAPRTPRERFEAWDPATGERRPVDLAAVVLHPYEAIVLVGIDDASDAPPLEPHSPQAIGRIELEVAEIAPQRYEARIRVPEDWCADGVRLELDLGPCAPAPAPPGAHGYRAEVATPVRDIAVVSVDGQEAGILWDAPYRLDLTGALTPGEHTLHLQVLGTAAADLAADPHADGIVEQAHRAYGDRFTQQDHDRALEGFAVGLAGDPVIRATAIGRRS